MLQAACCVHPLLIMYALIRSAQNNRTIMSGLFVVILIRSVNMRHFRNDILDEKFCLCSLHGVFVANVPT